MKHVVILDIGKTHIKLHLKNSVAETLDSRVKVNAVETKGLYPHFNTDAIWAWLIEGLREWSTTFSIHSLAITTHGATAALIDRQRGDNGLVLPVMDYEFGGVDSLTSDYDDIRPEFSETASPRLPAGLNLGKQLFWQQQNFAESFAQVTDILTYPQYWAWRLTGQCCSEVTSLGCHTDLWNPHQNQWSSLVQSQQWQSLFPPLKSANEVLGTVQTAVCADTGLPEDCQVFVGIHDSNASYYRYKAVLGQQPFTVLSTGTWCIAMKNQHRQHDNEPQVALSEQRDMLLNVDATATPTLCSRFMAGREMELLCDHMGGVIDEPYTLRHIQTLTSTATCFSLPSWAGATGPFPKRQGRVDGQLPNDVPVSALASLYLALMIDVQLDLVKARGTVILEGAYLKNPHLAILLASLRPQQTVYTSRDATGTVSGTYMLTLSDPERVNLDLQQIKPQTLPGLDHYRQVWRQQLTD